MRVLLDTNILVRMVTPNHPMHMAAVSAVQQLRNAGHTPVMVPQVLYEYWVVATRPAIQNGLGLTTADARSAVNEYILTFPLLRDERGSL